MVMGVGVPEMTEVPTTVWAEAAELQNRKTRKIAFFMAAVSARPEIPAGYEIRAFILQGLCQSADCKVLFF